MNDSSSSATPLLICAALAVVGGCDSGRSRISDLVLSDAPVTWTEELVFQRISRYGSGDVVTTICDGTGLYSVNPVRDEAEERLLRPSQELCHIVWQAERVDLHPDGHSLLWADTFRDGHVMRIDLEDLSTTELATTCLPLRNAPAWSPGGQRIAFSASCAASRDKGVIHVMNPDGSDAHAIGPVEEHVAETHPSWSPDGQQIAFTRSGEPWSYEIVVMDTASGRRRIVAEGFGPAWAPQGDWIAYVAYDPSSKIPPSIRLVRSDGTGDQLLHEEHIDASTQNSADSTGYTWPMSPLVWSPDGQWLAFVRARSIWMVRPDGTGLRQVTQLGTTAAAGEPAGSDRLGTPTRAEASAKVEERKRSGG